MKAKFTIKDFNTTYKTDDDCLDKIFSDRYGNLEICPECGKKTTFHKVSNRKCYACASCGYQLHPLADTIFHKSSTSLKNWFYAIFLFTASKNGVSAKELERQLGVTYKCAWRMAKQIRMLFEDDGDKLSNTVEADETYIGGKPRAKEYQPKEKQCVFGVVERQGKVKAVKVDNAKRNTLMPQIYSKVEKNSEIITDENKAYHYLYVDYKHNKVNHSALEFVRGKAHTNTIEGFWSQLKRSINGTYHMVSPKYLQTYVNEFCYRYNLRNSETPIFLSLISKVAKPF